MADDSGESDDDDLFREWQDDEDATDRGPDADDDGDTDTGDTDDATATPATDDTDDVATETEPPSETYPLDTDSERSMPAGQDESSETATDPQDPDPEAVREVAGAADSSAEDTVLDEGADEDVELDEELLRQAYGRTFDTTFTFEEAMQNPTRHREVRETISWSELREHYGPLRALFKLKESSYTSFQRQLAQAWVDETYDRLLARVVGRMVQFITAGLLLGVLAAVGVVAAAEYGALPRAIAQLGVPAARLASIVIVACTVGGAVVAAGYWMYYRIILVRQRIARRRREIQYNLPYAVTFMYALAQAGVGIDRIVLQLANSKRAYGAVSDEFERVVREVEMFGNNLHVGLENLRAVTPSRDLREFVDDITTILESGGELAGFLRDEVDRQIETAIAAQEAYVEQMELLSEVFVVGFVAAPLFTIVVLLVISFLGANLVPVIAIFVYVAIPLSLAAFVILIDVIGQPFAVQKVAGDDEDVDHTPPADADRPAWGDAYLRSKRKGSGRRRLADQIARFEEQPWRALLFSAPIGIGLVLFGIERGVIPASLSALLEQPVLVTTEIVVVPLVIALTPVVLVYERDSRRRRRVRERFPNVLELLATSNRRGLPLTRGLDIVTETTTGALSGELAQLRNDIRWNADVPAAFAAFGDRLDSPALSRTVHLLSEGSRVTSDLHVVLSVAAADVGERVRLERERRQSLQSYLVIVIVGFLVYLLVAVLLADNFLAPIETLAESAVETSDGPISLGAVPVDQLRLLLFHSALIQGFGSGLLAGKLVENTLYSGIKYGLALVTLTAFVFAFA